MRRRNVIAAAADALVSTMSTYELRLRRRVPSRQLFALVALVFVVSCTAGASAKNSQPFAYTFRISAVTVTATFTHGDSTVRTQLHLEAPSQQRTLIWLGPKAPNSNTNGVGPSRISLVGKATYTSPDPSCTQELDVRSSRSRPILAVLFFFGTRLHVKVHKFPLATARPGRDGTPSDPSLDGCGKPVVDWYDNANAYFPPSVFQKPSFTATAHLNEKFEDGEAVDWTLRMTVKRVRYRPIDCASAPGC